MRHEQIQLLIIAALLAALCCVATLMIQVPSPMNGYVNLGDGLVLLSGWLLGPGYGFAAAGLGSALADLITGYSHYAPATFIIKGLMALISCRLKPRWLGGILAEGWMVLGYFLFACLLMGEGWAAAASIPGNLIQGAVGLAAALALEKVTQRLRLR